MKYMSVSDHELAAAKRLAPAAFDYYAGGALDERAIAENAVALARMKLCNRALSGVRDPDTRSDLLGSSLSMPVIVAPTAFQGMAHPEGEVATARAAAKAGTVMVLSTTSTRSIEDVCAVADARVWFQLYMFKDEGINRELVRRAESAGCRAIVLTVDVPAWGRRERDMKNKFGLPPGMVIHSLLIPGRSDFYDGSYQDDLGSFINERFKFDLSWRDLDWLLKITKLPVILKGVMHPQDAATAVSAGSSGVIVSNHGGRQLDDAPSTIEALSPVVERVNGTIPVIVDGGFRRGGDVVKAMAVGADAVGIGRPILWGLASMGEEGVTAVLETLRAELRNSMSLCGCPRISDISRGVLWSPLADGNVTP